MSAGARFDECLAAANGAEPDWGTATMRCLSHWERE